MKTEEGRCWPNLAVLWVQDTALLILVRFM